MTALRVIGSHTELDDVGQLTHDQIDTYLTGSAFLVVSGSGPLPPAARRLVAGSGISIVDGGPGGDLTISATGGGSNISWSEIPSGSADGTNVTYGLAFTPSPLAALMFFVNGVLQKQGADSDYVLSGSVVTVNWVPRSGSNLTATYPY